MEITLITSVKLASVKDQSFKMTLQDQNQSLSVVRFTPLHYIYFTPIASIFFTCNTCDQFIVVNTNSEMCQKVGSIPMGAHD